MKVLIAAAIFGISCGMCGCSNEANVAGRPMAAAGATAAPAASPGAAIQTTADANAEVMTPAVVNPPAVNNLPAVINPPAVVLSRWEDATTNAAGAASSCVANPERCTFKQLSTSMKATSNLGSMNWTTGNARCAGLTYNGAAGWRLPSKEELQSMFTDRYETDVWSKAGWSANYWSASLYLDSNLAYYVSLQGGSAFDYTTATRMAGVSLDDVMRSWNSAAMNVLCVR